jgi:hypothetical protein
MRPCRGGGTTSYLGGGGGWPMTMVTPTCASAAVGKYIAALVTSNTAMAIWRFMETSLQ